MQNSNSNSWAALEFPESTAVVCHDAGAANVIIAGLQQTCRKDWRPFMCGPAEQIWKSAFPSVDIFDSLESALKDSELLISGTGWASDIEHSARLLARSLGIRSIALIDHWVNYSERFIRNNINVLPDEIWVTDEYALKIAGDIFPDTIIHQVHNHYIDTQLSEITNVDYSENAELLYILEPARSNWGQKMPGEFQALDYFISSLPKLELPSSVTIRLRPHPSDPPGKYDNWISRHASLNLQLDTSLDLGKSIGKATWVIGCESFALVLALMAGRKVYSSLPPWAPHCRLPHKGLIHLSQLGVAH